MEMFRLGLLGGCLALALTGCAATPARTEKVATMIPGLTSGPLPEPQPFVLETRPPETAVYPTIGYTPPPRREKPMTAAETAKMDADLQAAAGIRKKRKPIPAPSS